MIRSCLFCDARFPDGEAYAGFVSGRRIAWDAGRSRLWAICDHCHRWTLAPLDARIEAIEALERLARDQGRLLSSTANVALLSTARRVLLRVGQVDLAEEAWWRYGRELRRRRIRFERRDSRLGAWAFAAFAAVSEAVGLTDRGIRIAWDANPLADVMRWRRFPWAAWSGRVRCDHCRSVLLAVRFDLSWWLRPLVDDGGILTVGVPCDRCDPWTPDKVYRITGRAAKHLLRRVLAYQLVDGSSERMLREAGSVIREAGSAAALIQSVAGTRNSLWRLGPTRRLALEIAVNDDAERDELAGQARYFESIWHREEEIAAIADRL